MARKRKELELRELCEGKKWSRIRHAIEFSFSGGIERNKNNGKEEEKRINT